MDETISERKKKILQSVVNEYVESAIPVSSKAITQKHMTDVSSATVRSELAALEEMGYLTQFHTSGGRIPSPKAYKLYIEELLERSELTSEQVNFIRESFARRASHAESIVKSVADLISELTDYTSVALSDPSAERVKNVGLFPCGDKALLLLVTDLRILKDSFIALPEEMEEEELARISATLQAVFGGRRLDSVREAEAEAMNAFTSYRQVCREILDALFAYTSRKDVILSGESKSLQKPEYDDAEKVKEFLSLVESKEKIQGLLAEEDPEIRIQVKIGGEGVPEDCSLVSANYSVGGRQLGTYGVVGPVRMDYAKVVSVLENVGEILQKLVKN